MLALARNVKVKCGIGEKSKTWTHNSWVGNAARLRAGKAIFRGEKVSILQKPPNHIYNLYI